MVSVLIALLMGTLALSQTIGPLGFVQAALVALHKMREVTARKPVIDSFSESGAKPSRRPLGTIEFDDVVFAYPSRPDIQVCNGFNLRIEAGQSCALCGPSGAGKSTIISLLLRFYDPRSGKVTMDGENIRHLNVRWLRSQIGYVGQEPVLFYGSILENISAGIDDDMQREVDGDGLIGLSTKDRVVAAAVLANAHTFIMGFPEGYDTNVGSSGSFMSGGQKQRIAIARALVRRPAVLLLDEATSALDAASERLVQESIDALQVSKTQTTIIIAHRLSTIRNADKIAVVNGGRVVEEGTHEQLLVKNGLYCDLVRLQMDTVDSDLAHPLSKAQESGRSPNVSGDGIAQLNRHVGAGTLGETAAITRTPSLASKDQHVDKGSVSKSTDRLTDQQRQETSERLWRMIMRQRAWFYVGLVGAVAAGAAFPIFGYLLANVLSSFFDTSPHHLRQKTSEYAGYIGLLGLICGAGFFFQNYCIGRVSLHNLLCIF